MQRIILSYSVVGSSLMNTAAVPIDEKLLFPLSLPPPLPQLMSMNGSDMIRRSTKKDLGLPMMASFQEVRL
jgi:hypothetical protein